MQYNDINELQKRFRQENPNGSQADWFKWISKFNVEHQEAVANMMPHLR